MPRSNSSPNPPPPSKGTPRATPAGSLPLSPRLLTKVLPELERELRRRRATNATATRPAPSLVDFAKTMLPTYQESRHNWLLLEALTQVNEGSLKRLIVEAPPRHGKSELISVHFPPWYLGQHPAESIIHCAYGENLVRDFAFRAQQAVLHPKWADMFPGVALDPKSKSITHWRFAGHKGYYHASGVGGPIIGYGANVLIIDDPVRQRKDVENPAFREHQWQWYQSGARRRLEPGAAIIVTCTRWHTDDLIGRILRAAEESGERWTVLKLRAIAEADDLLGRAPGEPLWPEKWPLAELEKVRDDPATSLYEWSAQYQQHPVPPGGAIFKSRYWRTFDPTIPHRLVKVVQSWDTAFQKQAQHDYSAVWTAGLGYDGNFYVLDVQKVKATAAELIGTDRAEGLIPAYYKRFLAAGLPPTEVAIEDKGSGAVALQVLAANHPYLPLIPVTVGRDGKEERARAVVPYYEAGRVYHRDDGTWRGWFEPLCELFPGGPYDDPVDAMTQGLMRLALPPESFIEVFNGPRVSLGRY